MTNKELNKIFQKYLYGNEISNFSLSYDGAVDHTSCAFQLTLPFSDDEWSHFDKEHMFVEVAWLMKDSSPTRSSNCAVDGKFWSSERAEGEPYHFKMTEYSLRRNALNGDRNSQAKTLNEYDDPKKYPKRLSRYMHIGNFYFHVGSLSYCPDISSPRPEKIDDENADSRCQRLNHISDKILKINNLRLSTRPAHGSMNYFPFYDYTNGYICSVFKFAFHVENSRKVFEIFSPIYYITNTGELLKEKPEF